MFETSKKAHGGHGSRFHIEIWVYSSFQLQSQHACSSRPFAIESRPPHPAACAVSHKSHLGQWQVTLNSQTWIVKQLLGWFHYLGWGWGGHKSAKSSRRWGWAWQDVQSNWKFDVATISMIVYLASFRRSFPKCSNENTKWHPKSESLRHQKWRLDPWQEPKWSSDETHARWPSRDEKTSSHMPLSHGSLMQTLQTQGFCSPCNEQWSWPIFAFERDQLKAADICHEKRHMSQSISNASQPPSHRLPPKPQCAW